MQKLQIPHTKAIKIQMEVSLEMSDLAAGATEILPGVAAQDREKETGRKSAKMIGNFFIKEFA